MGRRFSPCYSAGSIESDLRHAPTSVSFSSSLLCTNPNFNLSSNHSTKAPQSSWLLKWFSTTSPPPQTITTTSKTQTLTTTIMWSPQLSQQQVVGPTLSWPTLANPLLLNPKTATPKSTAVAGGSGCPL
jgi:hypothetical protein